MVVIIVLPEKASFFKRSQTAVAVKESNPVVGSSKNKSIGSVISSTPIEVLFRSPPETPLINGPPILVF